LGWLWSVSSVVVDAVTARAAERQLTLRSAERRARVGGEAAGRRTLLLGQTRKKSPDTNGTVEIVSARGLALA
jgi:hypothetical protein